MGLSVIKYVSPLARSIDRDRPIAVGAQRRCLDCSPTVRPVVNVGCIEVPDRERVARRAVGDAAGFGHRPGDVAGDHRGVVGAVDGEGDELCGAVDGGDGKAIGQRVTDVERLHVGIAVVERVGPPPGRVEGVGAEAFGGGGAGRHRLPAVAWIVDVGGGEIACGCGLQRAVIDPAGLESPSR